MRIWSICVLLVVVCLGCNRAEEARRKAVENNLKQIGEELHNYHEAHQSSDSEFSHVIAAETEYYTTGPQQGRPPDGTFQAGTKVSVVENAGSYSIVESENGVRAYVATDSLKEANLEDRVETLLQEGRKIEALRVYRAETGVGLKEAKDAVDEIELRVENQ